MRSCSRPRPRRLGLLSTVLLLFVSPAVGQTTAPASTRPATTPAADLPAAKTIMKRALDAMGGLDKLEKIRSTHALTQIVVPGSPAPMEVETFWARPNKALMRRSISGIRMTHATDGTVAWTTNSMQNTYELLDEDAVPAVFRDANPQMALLSMGAEMPDGTKVERARFDQRDCYRVLLADPSPMNAYFDTDSGLLAGLSMDERAPSGETVEATMAFRDWKEHEGVRLAHLIVMTMPGMQAEMRTTKLTVNDVDPEVFDQPEAVRTLVAERSARAKAAATAPAGDDAAAPDLNPTMQRFMARVKQIDDPGQLAGMLSMLEGLRGQATPEEQAQVDFVLQVLRERIAELESGDDE